MKSTINGLFFFFMLIAASCSDSKNMITVIKSDGSCYREFTAEANTQFITGDSIEQNNPFPVDIDSSCQIKWKFRDSEWFAQYPVRKAMIDSVVKSINSKDTVKPETEKITEMCDVVLHKNYASVNEMASQFKLKKSHEWSKMKVKYSLEKKFRWFYTYYSYRETYPKLETNFEIPIGNYMTEDEARFWFTGQPDMLKGMNGIEVSDYIGSIEDKFNKWYAQNLWNNEFKYLLSNYKQIKNKPVSIEKLESLRDTIFMNNVKEFDKMDMEDILNRYFKTDVFSVLWNGKESPMNKYEDSLDEEGFMPSFSESFNYRLVMPGQVKQPEHVIQQGDTLIWTLNAYRMAMDDYTIEAQSRKANLWAFILTGLILIVAIGSFIWKPKRG